MKQKDVYLVSFFLMRLPILLLTILCNLSALPQSKSYPKLEVLTSGTNTSLRGLSVVNNQVVWVSGSNGTIGRSNDAGKSWKWFRVKGFEKTDFRDIEAFDVTTALIMGVGEPAVILRTIDGGETWKLVFENREKGMFLDAMEFWNTEAGIVIGDPLNKKFFVARTFNGGNTWSTIPEQNRPLADSGEACFAASGTNVRALDNDEAVFVSGGLTSHVYIRNSRIEVPVISGKETTGGNSIAVWDRYHKNGGKKLVVVGGDFNSDTSSLLNCSYSTNRGKTWSKPKVPPHGYRSCVEYLAKKILVCCGLSGVDYTLDNAANWKLISKESFHVCRIAKSGSAVFLAGTNGKVGRLVYPEKR